ncbi:flippase-like domain-containing protein [Dactylosporangium sp. CS-047395]|uniref:flippase-like domain-containing protein n=1 Tax=Dactylosporangium sp. CS-047395 TaxID=3239936 RepID=UPI003D8FEDD0
MSAPTTPQLAPPADPPRRRRRWVRLAVIAVIVIVLSAIGLHGRLPAPHEILSALAGADYGWIAVAVLLQAASIESFALQQRRLLNSLGAHLTRGHVMAITLAGTALSISMPAGPAVSTAFTIREYQRGGATREASAAAAIVSGLASIGGLALLYAGLAFALLARNPDGLLNWRPLAVVVAMALVTTAAIMAGRRFARRPDPAPRTGSTASTGSTTSSNGEPGTSPNATSTAGPAGGTDSALGTASSESLDCGPGAGSGLSTASSASVNGGPGAGPGLSTASGAALSGGSGAALSGGPGVALSSGPSVDLSAESSASPGDQSSAEPVTEDVAGNRVTRALRSLLRSAGEAWRSGAELKAGDWVFALVYATVKWLTDVLCLVAVGEALHLPVSVAGMATIYLSVQIVRQVPLTPGGVGVVEAALIAGLTAAGATGVGAAAAVLVYRVLSTWILIPIGGIAAVALRRQRERI